MQVSDPYRARLPSRTAVLSIFGLWLCYFVINTLRAELLDLGFSADLMWRRALTSIVGAAITSLLWLCLRFFDQSKMATKVWLSLILCAPFSLLLSQANLIIFDDIRDKVSQRKLSEQGLELKREENGDLIIVAPSTRSSSVTTLPNDTTVVMRQSQKQTKRSLIVEESFGRYFMILTWCALYIALLVGEKARLAERREAQAREAARAAELRSLRYQVNPHFLFNTFNSLSAMVLTGRAKEAERMIQTISRFYRRSLADDPTADVTLEEEFDLQRLYLDIEQVRFPKRLRFEFDLPAELAEARVPGMILQPIVENSVKHAVAPVQQQVTISISARQEYGRLVITVADDGGVPEGPAKTRPGFGIGLANVHDRLAAAFGDEAHIVSGPTPDGFATHIRLPLVGVKARAA